MEKINTRIGVYILVLDGCFLGSESSLRGVLYHRHHGRIFLASSTGKGSFSRIHGLEDSSCLLPQALLLALFWKIAGQPYQGYSGVLQHPAISITLSLFSNN